MTKKTFHLRCQSPVNEYKLSLWWLFFIFFIMCVMKHQQYINNKPIICTNFNIYFLITPVNVIACIHKLCQKYTLDFKQAPVRGTVYFIVNLLQQRTKKVSATQLPGGIRICIHYNIANILK